MQPISREELIDLCDAASPRLRWRFIHVPRTSGTAFRAIYGLGTVDSATPHTPASWFKPDRIDLAFSILRNPFDRAVSLCAYLHGRSRVCTPEMFAEWVARGCGAPSHPSIGASISEPQTHWLTDRVIRCRFEHREEDLKPIVERIGERPWRYIPKQNASLRRPDWREYYRSEEVRLAVLQRYESDFELGLWPTKI